MALLPHTIHKCQLLSDPGVNNKIVKFLEENIKANLFHLSIDKNFLNKTTQC